mmetsp:Transcript_25373/g.24989  ORF Transcript_25373/g.24989 Transcript_25373/m.24989 type:complete len:84 (+) Transcript_25373:6-257(+)|eukprot:CAMPEP_0202941240 /NCGR_PEP_ID=MMETSP1395-20130829/1363_1 /ASSEMBLY_ACC=CAM_ASM_000871 /TAXON_ID=5961 /ORGANISM="Blepharisma japonicum, Strain Stock R1072" /LENGTH=83 /DNA_ID=CAMNT_0049636283 /DNA_START=1 /DNA_END=252 /DNA_ORIENTATION=-
MSDSKEGKKQLAIEGSKDRVQQLKNLIWPSDLRERAARKSIYTTVGIFVASTVVLVKWGTKIADYIYNPALLEEQNRLAMQGL